MKPEAYILIIIFFFFLFSCHMEKAVVKQDRTTDVEIVEATNGPSERENLREGDSTPLKDERVPEPPSEPIDEVRETESIIDVIQSLEESYEKRDFEMWKNFLTDSYKKRYNDPKFLNEEGWDAKDLGSFFALLIETRKSANISALSISRVEFISSNKALVYVMFGDEEFPEPQHTFIKINDKWYKGLLEEGE